MEKPRKGSLLVLSAAAFSCWFRGWAMSTWGRCTPACSWSGMAGASPCGSWCQPLPSGALFACHTG